MKEEDVVYVMDNINFDINRIEKEEDKITFKGEIERVIESDASVSRWILN